MACRLAAVPRLLGLCGQSIRLNLSRADPPIRGIGFFNPLPVPLVQGGPPLFVQFPVHDLNTRQNTLSRGCLGKH
jgi:hypothetical protein